MYKLITPVLLVGICIVSMAVAGGADEGKESAAPGEAQGLKAAVTRLTEKVAALEERVQKLEASQQSIAITRSMLPDRVAKPLPEGWEQREINGIPYYIVPLDHGQSNRQQFRLLGTPADDGGIRR